MLTYHQWQEQFLYTFPPLLRSACTVSQLQQNLDYESKQYSFSTHYVLSALHTPAYLTEPPKITVHILYLHAVCVCACTRKDDIKCFTSLSTFDLEVGSPAELRAQHFSYYDILLWGFPTSISWMLRITSSDHTHLILCRFQKSGPHICVASSLLNEPCSQHIASLCCLKREINDQRFQLTSVKIQACDKTVTANNYLV